MKIISANNSTGGFSGEHKGFTFYVVRHSTNLEKYYRLAISDPEGILMYFHGKENVVLGYRKGITKENEEIVDEIIQYVKVRVRLL